MLKRALFLSLLMTQASLSAPVSVEADSFAKQEVARLVRQMEKDRLVSFTRAGTLILGSPSQDVTDGLQALGDSCVAALASEFLVARTDGVRYGIGLALANRGQTGEKALIRLLRTPNLKGRRWLLQGLSGKVTGPIVATLRVLIRDTDHELAERAILDLAETEDDLGFTLIRELLKGPDAALAKKAALALAFQKDASGVQLLLEDFREAKNGALALFQTMKGLGLSGAREAVGPLVTTFASYASKIDEDEAPGRVTGLSDFEARFRKMPVSERAMLVAGNAASALASLNARGPRPEILALVDHANPHVQRMAVDILGAVGDASAAPRLLKLVEAGVPARQTDAGRRGELGHAADGEEDDDGGLAIAAAQALRNIAPREAQPRLHAAYKRAPRPLQDWIALALAAIGDADGVRRTVQLARGENDFALAAITTLGGVDAPAAVDHLTGLMELGEAQLALLAASSLSRPGNVHARKPLEAMLAAGLKEEEAPKIGVAALGLGLVGDTSATRQLESLTRHADRSVRRAAVTGLYYLTGEARRYQNAWGEDVTFAPTTFHAKMREQIR